MSSFNTSLSPGASVPFFRVEDTDKDTYINFEIDNTNNDEINFYNGGVNTATISNSIFNLNALNLDVPVGIGASVKGVVNIGSGSLTGIIGDLNMLTLGFKNGLDVFSITDGRSILIHGQTPTFLEVTDSVTTPQNPQGIAYTNSAYTVYPDLTGSGANLLSLNKIRIQSTESLYNNTNSGLNSENTQTAIDELATRLILAESSITAIAGVNTNQSSVIARLLKSLETEKRTVTANFALVDTDAETLQLVVNSATPVTAGLTGITWADKRFLLINDSTSTANLVCNGSTIPPGEQYVIVRIAGAWVEI